MQTNERERLGLNQEQYRAYRWHMSDYLKSRTAGKTKISYEKALKIAKDGAIAAHPENVWQFLAMLPFVEAMFMRKEEK